MSQQLIDQYGRSIEYLRLSVTDRCDLRCHYCMPEGFKDFDEPENWLTFDEIERVIRLFGELGTKRIRITGGGGNMIVDNLLGSAPQTEGQIGHVAGNVHP